MSTSTETTTFPAVVAYAPSPHPVWKYHASVSHPSTTTSPAPNELLIRMVATGVCHTDVWASSIPEPMAQSMGMTYPRVLGHEGAGYVEAVGANVSVAQVGDPVLLSYDYCGACEECGRAPGKGTYCDEFGLRNSVGVPARFVVEGKPAAGKFFGQSSFARVTLVEDKCVVNVKGLVEGDAEMKVLAPLGCGLMTGSGAIVNVCKPWPEQGVLVTGVGAVGLGAIMAARIQGVKTIVAVDRVKRRLEVAKELGATVVVDTTGLKMEEVQGKIREALGQGVELKFAIETTGVPGIVEQSMQALGRMGKLIQIGIPPMDAEARFRFIDIAFQGKTFQWNVLGDSVSREALPMMIKWWREGKFPVEKLCKFFKADEAEEALKGMEDGSAIKPVLVW